MMKKTTSKNLVFLLFVLFSFGMQAQNPSSLWSPIAPQDVKVQKKETRNAMPSDFELFNLETEDLKTLLATAPSRKTTSTSNVIITLPTEDGLQKFKVFEASIFSEGLSEKFPGINSYVGQGIDDPTAMARFSVSQVGVHVMILSAKHTTTYIDPYTKDKTAYISYSRASLPADTNNFVCHVEDNLPANLPDVGDKPAQRNADDGMLRTFRLALACNGEYAQWHLNNQGVDPSETDAVKKAAVLSAMNVAMTRVNGIYERDLAVTMEFIPENEDIIFLDTATDGLSNNSGMINQIQAVIDNAVGFNSYDIGHVFSTGGGGIAQLNSPCTSNKARGVTGLPQPIGDGFYVDYVSHEMGHQYGGNHTQNNNCQRSNASVEPGSASTIMGYAGICPPNVQSVSDDYFHAISIQEMWSNITVGNSQCADQTPTGNDAPTADAGADFTIPKSTPFILKGNGTDPNSGDVLTYSWEQFDSQVAAMPPQNTSTGGPAFRSLDPMASPNRYMPALPTVLNGSTQSTWEVVPAVGRLLRFRLTVRDNVVGGAASASDNTRITVDGDSGPFVVTSQDNNPEWKQGLQYTITWDVANTDVAPVDSPTVDILLSIDGLNYDTVLIAGTPNDGSEVITVPGVDNTEDARVMVAGTDHLFYALNAEDILIDENLSVDEASLENFTLWPNPTTGLVNLEFVTTTSSKVSVAVYDVRGRQVAGEEYNNQGGTFKETFNYSSLNSGMYFITVTNGDKKVTSKLLKN
ncbi:zinc-dependent metalloprotease [Marixanthomonas ophiurae]|uniref:T9SS C-terminal target domain-containing protein n=1 Tax=Marixanthomonas ophiurae TaxID=387659 RepID=A0A3E1Q9D4_9FLAO|nr:zinc-dependent metalloprotease family protein [Marixanthomonas ophiurae]RFN58741.1 T9SS C-terminal target domain-containing protein [Marixanthomonas ophiurae]